MKLTRLLEITTLLMNRDVIRARELADRFDVSVRTIYRDIEDLSSAGVPVYMTRGSSGGISLLKDYTLNKTVISEQEIESLFVALKTLEITRYPEIDRIINKLGTLFRNAGAMDWVEIDFSYWGSLPDEKNKFTEIKKAVLQRRVIQFSYVNADGVGSDRHVEPLKLLYKGNAWYLVAYCRYRGEHRVFRITRIKNVQVTGETFTERVISETEKERMEDFSKPLTRLRLRFQPEVLSRLYDDFDDAYIIKNADQTVNVEAVIPEDEWLYAYIMSFGSFVEVLEPERIKSIITARLQQALKNYEKRPEDG